MVELVLQFSIETTWSHGWWLVLCSVYSEADLCALRSSYSLDKHIVMNMEESPVSMWYKEYSSIISDWLKKSEQQRRQKVWTSDTCYGGSQGKKIGWRSSLWGMWGSRKKGKEVKKSLHEVEHEEESLRKFFMRTGSYSREPRRDWRQVTPGIWLGSN